MQKSNENGEKDRLVPMSELAFDPYRCKPSDFPMKKNSSMVSGQSSDEPGQQDQLVKQSDNQESPRHVEDSNERSDRDSMAERVGSVSSNFKVGKNMGEGSVAASSPAIAQSVDFADGYIDGEGDMSSVRAVPDKLVRPGAASVPNMGKPWRPRNSG